MKLPKKSLAFILFFLCFGAMAQQNCIYNTKADDIAVKWTAYKTPAKVGVEGTFSDIKFKGKMSAESISKIAQNLTATINNLSVNTNNPARDKTIFTFFFKLMKKKEIKVKILNATDKDLEVEINMNGKKQKLVMESKIENDTLSAEGVIDVLNFNLSAALKSLADTCRAKHEDKTWPHVKLNITAKFQKKCK